MDVLHAMNLLFKASRSDKNVNGKKMSAKKVHSVNTARQQKMVNFILNTLTQKRVIAKAQDVQDAKKKIQVKYGEIITIWFRVSALEKELEKDAATVIRRMDIQIASAENIVIIRIDQGYCIIAERKNANLVKST